MRDGQGPRLGRRTALGLAGAAGLAAGARAQAQAPAQAPAWPTRPVTIISVFPAGGSTDFAARIFQHGFQSAFGQPAAVDNRTGGGGLIGAEAAARARDGHTLLVANFSTITVNPHIMEGVALDPLAQLAPIGTVMQGAALFCVHAARVPARTLAEFAAWAKAKPGGVDYGSSGPGSQMAMEILRAGIGGPRMEHVPYRGSAPLMQDLLTGRVLCAVDALPSLLPHVQAGTLHAILATGDRRSAILPQLPTAAESGVPDLVLNNWEGLFAPAGTPQPVLDRLGAYLRQVVADPEVRQRMLARGAEPGGDFIAEFTAKVRADHARWGAAARAYGIRAG